MSHLSAEPIEQEFRIVRADGAIIWIREEARVIESSNLDSILAHGFLVDITERKVLEAELARLAFQDPLTGLANRAVFEDRLRAALARSRRSSLHPAVLFLDLDDFKTVNDSLGHSVGDRLLEMVGERLRTAVRPADCVARLGGDEFAVILDEVSGAEAIATAKRLLELLEAPIEVEGRVLTARGSIGIALGDRTVKSPEDSSATPTPRCIAPRLPAAGRGPCSSRRCTPRPLPASMSCRGPGALRSCAQAVIDGGYDSEGRPVAPEARPQVSGGVRRVQGVAATEG